jgi:hypothetical protein
MPPPAVGGFQLDRREEAICELRFTEKFASSQLASTRVMKCGFQPLRGHFALRERGLRDSQCTCENRRRAVASPATGQVNQSAPGTFAFARRTAWFANLIYFLTGAWCVVNHRSALRSASSFEKPYFSCSRPISLSRVPPI